MTTLFNISQLNPLKFYKQSDILNTSGQNYGSFNPNINERGIDNDFFYRNLKSWMDKKPYLQPYQQGDKITLQWIGEADQVSPSVIAYVVRLIDVNGIIVKQQNATQTAGVGVTIRECSMQLYDVPEGKYFVQIMYENPAMGGINTFAISEGIDVKQYHAGTMLYKYRNTTNDQDIFWETGIVMQFRLHSYLKINPDAKFSTYEDQPLNLQMLNFVPFREWELVLGVNTKPFAPYILDKVNRITGCDTLYIDNVLYTRGEGAKLEAAQPDKYPLMTATLLMREKVNDNNTLIVSNEAIVVMGATNSDWFYVTSLVQTTPATTYTIGKAFNGMRNFCDYLNTSNIIGTENLVGSYFAIDAYGRLVLITDNQTIFTNFSPGLTATNVYQAHMIFDVNTESGFDLLVGFATVGSTKYAYVWGDGTANSVGTSGGITVTHTYTTVGDFKAKLFWDDTEEIAFATSDVTVKSAFGKLPASCTKFYLNSIGLVNVLNNIFANLNGSFIELQLTGNKIGTYQINDVLMYLYESADKLDPTCVIDISGQTPSAPPSNSGGIGLFIGTLESLGITVTTD